MPVEVLAEGHGDGEVRPGNGVVQSVQEGISAIRVVLPGVFAVEGHDHDRTVVLARLGAVPQFLHERLDRLFARPAAVYEANLVRQEVVAEEDRHPGEPVRAHALGEGHGSAQRTTQDFLVGAYPAHPARSQDADRGLGHGAFRGPHSRGPAAEGALEVREPLVHLPLRLFRGLDAGPGKPGRWVGLDRRVGRAQQWEDRVVERRRGHLDLPGGPQVTVQRHDPAQELAAHGQQRAPVGRGEIAPPGGDFLDARVLLQGRAAPHQQVQDREVQEVAGGEPVDRRPLDRRSVHQVEQFAVPGEAGDHGGLVHAEAGPQQELAVRRRQQRRVLRHGLEGQVRNRAAFGVSRQALEQAGREVHVHPHLRVPPGHLAHVVVVLGAVKVGPREQEEARARLLVGRLVHVPQERDVDAAFHGGRIPSGGLERPASRRRTLPAPRIPGPARGPGPRCRTGERAGVE